MTPDFDAVGKCFAHQYYQWLSSNFENLRTVYRTNSLVTWNGEQIVGGDSLLGKLRAMNYKRAIVLNEIDCHPVAPDNVLVVVQGELKFEGEAHSLTFNDSFFLKHDQGGWFVQNQLSRILGGGSS